MYFITFAGLPQAMAFSGTSLTTTEPAPIIALSPILISPIMTEFAPMFTLLPITGHLPPNFEFPMVVQCLIIRFLPMIVS